MTDLFILAEFIVGFAELIGTTVMAWTFWPYFRAQFHNRIEERKLRHLGKTAEADDLLRLLRGF